MFMTDLEISQALNYHKIINQMKKKCILTKWKPSKSLYSLSRSLWERWCLIHSQSSFLFESWICSWLYTKHSLKSSSFFSFLSHQPWTTYWLNTRKTKYITNEYDIYCKHKLNLWINQSQFYRVTLFNRVHTLPEPQNSRTFQGLSRQYISLFKDSNMDYGTKSGTNK